MSSIICDKCGELIIDAPGEGYITACEHYPPRKLDAISGRSFKGEWWYNPLSWGCGKGWHPIIWRLIKDLKKIAKKEGTEFAPTQIKEKYGELRFYMQGYTTATEKRIDEAEAECEKTCESCGTNKQYRYVRTRYNNGWYNTFCKKCHNIWVKDTGYSGKAKVVKWEKQ